MFFEPIIKKLKGNHQVFCTSRQYGEVSKLAKIRKIKLEFIGKHGGIKRSSKLDNSINRMKKLSVKIQKFSPDLTLSFCSPEAARVSFGLGIRHIAFCDSPHATAVMKLSVPLVEKLLIPWVIPKNDFLKYGIKKEDIIQYKAIDAAITIKNIPKESKKLPISKNKKNIIIRIEEEQASYVKKGSNTFSILKQIINDYEKENIIILSRYESQIKKLKAKFGKKAKILDMRFDGRVLLKNSDIFIGSGGTMTAEAALIGVPTISYNAVPNRIEEFIVKQRLAKRETNPKKISETVKKFLSLPRKKFVNRANKVVNSMDDPYRKLVPLF